MKPFKKVVLGAILAAGFMAASATAAQAAQVNATGPWTASAGTTQFTVAGNAVTCTTSTASGNLSAPVPPGGSTTLNLQFSNCTAFGFINVPISCSGNNRLLVDQIPNATTAIGRVSLVAGACTISAPGCTITVPSPSGYTSPASSGTLNTTAQTVTIDAPLNIPFTSSGGFGCTLLGVPSSGTGQWSGPGGADVVYSRTSGTAWSITYP